ncbi:hypothetical protein BH23PLA1_BH23PLA1_14070 [soil metagenome]
MNRSAAEDLFSRLDRELWLVTAASAGRLGGLIATLVSQASIGPDAPRVVLSMAKQHHTWTLVEQSRAFGLHLIAENQLDLAWRFGLTSGRDVNKFEGLSYRLGASGAPILPEMPGWLDCRVLGSLDAGDRTIYLGEVVDAASGPACPLLTASQMLKRATSEQRQRLDEAYQRDQRLQAAALQTWRRSRSDGGPE